MSNSITPKAIANSKLPLRVSRTMAVAWEDYRRDNGDIAFRRQALCEPYRFANAIDDDELPVAQLTDYHMKTV